jgi:hypothetical protein
LKRARRFVLLDCFLVYLLAAALIWPLFKLKYMENWPSIESTFIADARFLTEHWPHPRWQPLWYGGTRFDYIYPPALRYGTALLVKLIPPMVPARAYHLYTAIFFALGIVGVYLLVWAGTRTRKAAWVAALAATLLSPSYLFLKHYRDGMVDHPPVRLFVLTLYGEGPHMTAFAVLGLALAASFIALQRWRPGITALSACLCALVVSNNFYGGTALATFFPVLCWAIYVTHQDALVWLRGAFIAILSYGLTAFWLTPSYFKVTTINLRLVSERGTTWSLYLLIIVAISFVILSHRLAKGRKERAYTVFVIGSAVFFSLNVLGQYYFKFRVAGEPERLVPELDLVLILLSIEGLRRLWDSRNHVIWKRAFVILVLLCCLYTTRRFLRKPWALYPRADDPKGRIEYQLAEWIAKNAPDSRSLVSGTVRFWWNAWFNGAQVGGGSEQGVLNHRAVEIQWQVLQGGSAEIGTAWMQSMGVDYVIVNFKESQEWYKDWAVPGKFDGFLPVVYNSQKGDKIYKVPRRYPSLARVVNRATLEALAPPQNIEDLPRLRAYADMAEKGPDAPTQTRWEGSDTLHIKAKVREGEAILVQITHDKSWAPYSGGRRLNTWQDFMGQTIIEAPPGEHDIRMVFELPLQNLLGWIAAAISLGIVAALLFSAWKRKEVSP